MAPLTSNDTDKERHLVRACAGGDQQAREEFVQRYGRLIIKVAAATRERLSVHTCEVEDLVGHVYEKLLEDDCRRLMAWREMSKLSTYVAMVARNLVIDYVKKIGKMRSAPLREVESVMPSWIDLEESAEIDAQRDARLKALKAALGELPQQQLAIMLLRLEGNSLRDIAAMMAIPQGTVFVFNSRAMQKLKKTIVSMTETPSM